MIAKNPLRLKLLQLEEIDFAENSLQYIPTDVKFLKQLRDLDLSKNDFEEFPVELCFVTTLTKLLFNDNHITTLPFQIQNVSNYFRTHLEQTCIFLTTGTELKVRKN